MVNLLSRKLWALPGLVLVLCASCHSGVNQSLPLGQKSFKDVNLTIAVNPATEGKFEISGKTNLPRKTRLTALALRYLEPTQPIVANAQSTYSILDYQVTQVKGGQWSTTLDLWQVAEDGRYLEAWQEQSQQLNLSIRPDENVHFVITLAPKQFLATVNRNLTKARLKLPSTLLRTTSDGEPLLWTDYSLVVDLPQGQTDPPLDIALRRNGGWGERYLLIDEPPLPYTLAPEDERKTNAPPALGEFLQ